MTGATPPEAPDSDRGSSVLGLVGWLVLLAAAAGLLLLRYLRGGC